MQEEIKETLSNWELIKANSIQIIASILIAFTSFVAMFKDYKEKENHTFTFYFVSYIRNILGGFVAWIISLSFTETSYYLWLGVISGSWAGVKMLDVLSNAFIDRYNKFINDDTNKEK